MFYTDPLVRVFFDIFTGSANRHEPAEHSVLGGSLPIDPDLSARVIERKIGRPMGLGLKEAALGIIRVVNSNMALAIRSNSVARGVDPREFSLVPFGGAGPLHGVALAEAVFAKDIIVPVAPGMTAAMGLLQTDMQYEHARSFITSLTKIEPAAVAGVNGVTAELVDDCRRDLENDGVPRERQKFQRFAECRYHGQGFELRAAMPEGEITGDGITEIMRNFHEQHRLDYGYAFDDGEIELITIRVIGMEAVTPLKATRLDRANGAGVDGAFLFDRSTTFDDGRTLDTPRYDRDVLKAGHRIPGPAVVLQQDSTSLIPPGYVAEVTEFGNLHIQRGP